MDCSVAAVESADIAIAVINPNVPFAYGDLLNLEQFDYLVKDDTPLISLAYSEPSPTDILIGKHTATLVEDGDCLQMGIGSIPDAIAAQLKITSILVCTPKCLLTDCLTSSKRVL